jgi:hypothetical protein
MRNRNSRIVGNTGTHPVRSESPVLSAKITATRIKLVELLIQRGAPAHESDAEPWATPEAWAAKMKHDVILAILLEHL